MKNCHFKKEGNVVIEPLKQYLDADEVERIVKSHDDGISDVTDKILEDLDNMEAVYPKKMLDQITEVVEMWF